MANMEVTTIPPSLLNRTAVSTNEVLVDVVDEFSVVSYNILADCHTKPSYYPYRDPQYLGQDFRHSVLMKEIDHLNADVYCLQEVDTKYYTATLETEMTNRGYTGLFVKRTISKYKEGSATFFKTSKFTLTGNKVFSLDNFAEEAIADSGITNKNFISRYAEDRGSILQMTSLRLILTQHVVTIANTHLVWQGPEIPDVRCIQAACCIKALQQFSNESVGTIFCGDFNAEPATTTYHMITKGGNITDAIAEVQPYLDEYWLSNFEMVIATLRKDMKSLQSTYDRVMGREPDVTNLDASFEDCLDYIFFGIPSSSSLCLVPTQVLDVLTVSEMRENLPPSQVFPSDHLPLMTKFAIKKK